MLTYWLLLCMVYSSMAQLDLDIKAEELRVTAVEGDRARFPCNLTSPLPHDQIYLVLWYRASSGRPVYTFDARGGSMVMGKHDSYDPTFKRRSRFLTLMDPPSLIVSDITEDDEDTYTCRVEFRDAPTQYTKTHLNIIVPPETITLLDESGRRLRGKAGPYEEGTRVKLTCRATGGDPPPTVTWWKNGEIIDQTSTVHAGVYVTNDLYMEPLTREDLDTVVTCQATNNRVTLPLTAKARIDMKLRPLDVRITTEKSVLSAGRSYAIVCESGGARPAANLSWWKDNQKIRDPAEVTSSKNISRSVLVLVPQRLDDGKQLRCQTDGYTQTLQASWQLSVQYAPEVAARVIEPSNQNNISLGDNIFLVCEVIAKPASENIYWIFQGKKLRETSTVKPTRHSLSITNITLEQSGGYQCAASNTEGTGYSHKISIRVRYAPRCIKSRPLSVSLSPGDTVKLKCEVEADPSDVGFDWRFNSTLPLSEKDIKGEGIFSTLQYTPRNEKDYGEIGCWAHNKVGRQEQPCLFKIIRAGAPEAPVNCTQLQGKHQNVEVICMEGFNGGAQQTFHLMLKPADSDQVTLNLTSYQPHFHLDSMDPTKDWIVSVYASNSQGDSPHMKLALDPLLLKSTSGPPPEPSSSSPPIVLILISILLVIVLLFAVAIFLRLRLSPLCLSKKKKQNVASTSTKLNSSISETDSSVGKILKEDVDFSKTNNTEYELTIIPIKKKGKKKGEKNREVCVMMKILPDDSSLIYPDYEDPDDLQPWKFNSMPLSRSPYRQRLPKKQNSQSAMHIASQPDIIANDLSVPAYELYLAEKLRNEGYRINFQEEHEDDDEDLKFPIPESNPSSLDRDKNRQSRPQAEVLLPPPIPPPRLDSLPPQPIPPPRSDSVKPQPIPHPRSDSRQPQTVPHTNPHRTLRKGLLYKPFHQYRSGSCGLIESVRSEHVCVLPMNKRTSISCGYVPSVATSRNSDAKCNTKNPWDSSTSSVDSSTSDSCQNSVIDLRNTVV